MKSLPRRLFSLVLAGLVCAACARPAPEAAPPEAAAPEEAVPAETGVVLVRAGLWEPEAGGKLKWTRPINAGEVVGWTNEKAKFVNTANNQENDYWRVDKEGGEFWIRDYAAAGPARPAVVVRPDTVLYSRPDLGSITTGRNKTIRQWSIAAAHEEADGFTRISAYYVSAGQYYVFNNLWLKTENLSLDSADVRAVSLYQLALESGDLVVRRELLNNALSLSRRIGDLAEREFIEMEFAGRIEAIKPLAFTVAEDELAVYDRPDFETAALVGRVTGGETVRAVAKTKEMVKNRGMRSAYLYKIDSPGGWVSGAYLTGEEEPEENKN